MKRPRVPDTETWRLWPPALARLLLWAGYAAGLAGAWLHSVPVLLAAVIAACASAVIYGRAWSAAVKEGPGL